MKRKAGQFYVHNGIYFRLAKREGSCTGCPFKDEVICPNSLFIRGDNSKRPECIENNVILTNI